MLDEQSGPGHSTCFIPIAPRINCSIVLLFLRLYVTGRTRLFLALGLVGFSVALFGLIALRQSNPKTEPSDTAKSTPVTIADDEDPQTESPATLTRSEAIGNRSVGTQACAECHQERYQSYLQTAHSRSLRRATAEDVKTDVSMIHPLSKRSYDILRNGDRVWHRQWEHFRPTGAEPSESDPKLLLTDLPVEYIMGSGTYAEAYLLRDGDFMMQSPVTWYSADQDYAMAPGYDAKRHFGCNRVIDKQCLFCHAGQVSFEQPERPKIMELAIGCERCHGPSATHVSYHQSRRESAEDAKTPEDARSINPSSLPRRELESICAQCHLNGDAVVQVKGKDIWDFTPGNDFSETRLAYHAIDGNVDDPFAQHFDQMWQSKCYQGSETMTCITCHDPHHGKLDGDLATRNREMCFSCHDNEACGMPLDRRTEQQQNRCVVCHMPVSQSGVVHTATTNHRIGIHPQQSPRDVPSPDAGVVLRRLQPPPPGMSDREIKTADRLAEAFWLLEHSDNPPKIRGLDAATIEAAILAIDDTRTPYLLAALGRLADLQAENSPSDQVAQNHSRRAESYARQALADTSIDSQSRIGALEVLSNHQFRFAEHAESVSTYEKLTQLRRSAIDHYNFGLSLGKLGQLEGAAAEFRESIRIDPSYPLPYRSLSVLYRTVDPQMSQQMKNIANGLIQNAN